MLWLWIILAIVILLILLLLLRVGMEIRWDGTLTLKLRLGPLAIQLIPEAARKPAKKKKPPKTKKVREPKAMPKLTLEDGFSAVQALGPALLRTLRRLGGGIRIHPARVSLILGGAADPAEAAERYGKLHTLVWTAMPQAERLVNIPSPGIHIGLDFTVPETRVQADLGFSLRLGTLFAAALGLAVPAVQWLQSRRKRPETKSSENPAESTRKAADRLENQPV